MIKKNNIACVIDESSLLYSGFFQFLKGEGSHMSIYIDHQLPDRIKDYIALNQFMEAYTLETALGILTYLNNISSIETSTFLDFSHVETLLKLHESVYIVSQKQSILRKIPSSLVQNPKFKAGQLQNNHIEWVDLSEPDKKSFTDAFYNDDLQYVKPISLNLINVVYSTKYGYLLLDKTRNYSGGEGLIYPTFNGFMVKLYDEKHQTYSNVKKIQRMIQLDIHHPSIIWPLDIVYFEGHFVGYIMKEIKNVINLNDEFDLAQKRIQPHPYYRTLALLNVLKPIDYLHRKNILVSDLKDSNILIRDEKHIYIVDSGSFQIEDYASTVLTPGWVDETFDKDFDAKKKLRIVEDEYYAIYRIAFEILIGKSPHFNPNDTEVKTQDTKSFHFQQKPNTNSLKTARAHEKLWAIYSQRIRDAFYFYLADSKSRRITYLETLILELEKELIRFKAFVNAS
jgi:hypothetical protein